MYQENSPVGALPSTRALMRSTLVAVMIAGVLLVGVVLPAEYGVDPVGIGRVLGLTEMGRIKMELAREADGTDAVASSIVSDGSGARVAAVGDDSGPAWRDSVTVALAPGKGIEVKLLMTKGQQAVYLWRADSADVSYNAHGEPPNPPKGFAHGYGRGVSRGASGDLVAAFDGIHGWFWRNRSEHTVRITLLTRGEYQELQEIK